MSEVVIVGAARTAIGAFNGSLATVSAPQLGVIAAREAMARAGIAGDKVDEAVFGNILQAGLGQNPARQVAIGADIPVEVPATTINILCGSGLKSVVFGTHMIKAGAVQSVLVGGMENMSAAPYLLDKARWGYRMGDGKLIDSMMTDALTCVFNNYHMGITAENIAERYKISREEQDEVALRSQQRAMQAIKNGAFEKEITPVTIKGRKGDTVFSVDEFPRADATAESLAKMRAAFKPDGTVTAGNASGLNDGAAALVVMSAQRAKELGLKPLARIRSCATAGVDPAFMGMGPVSSTQKALAAAHLNINDIDLVEANEAFAAQFAAVGKELGFDMDKTNVNGGAIALGHPVGASGARILVSLLYALEARNKTLGLATLCVGGGQGVSVIVERLS